MMNAKLYMPTQRLDVKITVLKTETRALKHMMPIHLHIGADHLTARVAILGANSISPGKTGFVQLVLPRSVSSLYGDRFIIRDQSAQRTLPVAGLLNHLLLDAVVPRQVTSQN